MARFGVHSHAATVLGQGETYALPSEELRGVTMRYHSSLLLFFSFPFAPELPTVSRSA